MSGAVDVYRASDLSGITGIRKPVAFILVEDFSTPTVVQSWNTSG